MLCQAQVILIPNYLISFENPCFLFPLANTQGSRVKVVNLWLVLSFSDAHLVQRQIITSPGCPTRGGNTTTNWASCLLRSEGTKMWLMFGAKSFQATCRTALIGNFEYLGAWLSPLYIQPSGSMPRAAAPKRGVWEHKSCQHPSVSGLVMTVPRHPNRVWPHLEPDSLLLILTPAQLAIFSGKKSQKPQNIPDGFYLLLVEKDCVHFFGSLQSGRSESSASKILRYEVLLFSGKPTIMQACHWQYYTL